VRGEGIAGHGLFVMNALEEIRQAFEDYQLGRMREIAD
jgi:redox-sensitive bicupin YhaK (pirin superfamily)